MGITGNLLKMIEDFLSEKFQQVVLNETSSDWVSIKVGVPHRSILRPLLLLVYISDIANDFSSIVHLLVDNTSLFSVITDNGKLVYR